MIIDIFSRKVVGWCVADTESAALFKPLSLQAAACHAVEPGALTLHADRGPSMKAKATALMLADLGVTKSHSRPHTSNDNPFSESHFKTLKYQPQFPKRFGCAFRRLQPSIPIETSHPFRSKPAGYSDDPSRVAVRVASG